MEETTPTKTVRCRNPQNGVVYVYSYELFYDPAQKKYRQHRRCIGKVDPETGDVVPTSSRGSRKAKEFSAGDIAAQAAPKKGKTSKEESYILEIQNLKEKIRTMDTELAKVRRDLIQSQQSKERLRKALYSVLEQY